MPRDTAFFFAIGEKSGLAIWRLYPGRANCENRIKVLKYDFPAGSLCMQEFWATEAALNVVMLAFNLMSLFRQVMLKTPPNTRWQHFAISSLPKPATSPSRDVNASSSSPPPCAKGNGSPRFGHNQNASTCPLFLPPFSCMSRCRNSGLMENLG